MFKWMSVSLVKTLMHTLMCCLILHHGKRLYKTKNILNVIFMHRSYFHFPDRKKNVIYSLTMAFLGASGRIMHTCIRMINVMPNILLNHTMSAFIWLAMNFTSLNHSADAFCERENQVNVLSFHHHMINQHDFNQIENNLANWSCQGSFYNCSTEISR